MKTLLVNGQPAEYPKGAFSGIGARIDVEDDAAAQVMVETTNVWDYAPDVEPSAELPLGDGKPKNAIEACSAVVGKVLTAKDDDAAAALHKELFTDGGVPTTGALFDALGEKVNAADRDTAWTAWLAANADLAALIAAAA